MDDTIINKGNLPENLWPGWETVRKIGEGSYGSVYEIKREVAGYEEVAALKQISIPRGNTEIQSMLSEGYSKEDVTKHFKDCLLEIEREYGIMTQIKDCENIVKCENLRTVQHTTDTGWDVFIKMELLTGLTQYLDEKYQGKTVVPDEEVIALGKAMCNALVECGKHNIIHRDIKPQNILVSKNGTYKLGDFGTARTFESSTGLTGGIGTKNYMSPEVAFSKKYDYRADIYSVGMVMYWMLNERRLPFLPLPPVVPNYSETTEAIQKRLEGNEIPAPAHGSNALKAVVLKALSFEADERYENAAQMIEELETILFGKKTNCDAIVNTKKSPDSINELNEEISKAANRKTIIEKKYNSTPIFIGIIAALLLVIFFLIIGKNIPPKPEEQEVREQIETTPIIITPVPTQDFVWSEWSDWSTNEVSSSSSREVETRQNKIINGYYMVQYGTQQVNEPHNRMFRDYSIIGSFEQYGARDSYGEKHLTRYATTEQMKKATSYPPNGAKVFLKNNGQEYGGLQMGKSTAYNFGDDSMIWFIESEDYFEITEYRYRDLLQASYGTNVY